MLSPLGRFFKSQYAVLVAVVLLTSSSLIYFNYHSQSKINKLLDIQGSIAPLRQQLSTLVEKTHLMHINVLRFMYQRRSFNVEHVQNSANLIRNTVKIILNNKVGKYLTTLRELESELTNYELSISKAVNLRRSIGLDNAPGTIQKVIQIEKLLEESVLQLNNNELDIQIKKLRLLQHEFNLTLDMSITNQITFLIGKILAYLNQLQNISVITQTQRTIEQYKTEMSKLQNQTIELELLNGLILLNYDRLAPILSKSQTELQAILIQNRNSLNAVRFQNQWISLVVYFLSFSTLAIYLLYELRRTRSVTKRIKLLASNMNAVATGDFDCVDRKEDQLKKQDEIDYINSQFIWMANQLKNQLELIAQEKDQITVTLTIVGEKNKQIESILANLNEGILLLESELTVAPNCSPAYYEMAAEAGFDPKNFQSLITTLMTDKTADECKAIETSLACTFGAEIFQWHFNSHLMPKESQYKTINGQQRLLEWEWSPIENNQGIINQVLISIRDVTEFRQLQLKAEKNLSLMAILNRILEIGHTRTQQFLQSAKNYNFQNINMISKLAPFATVSPKQLAMLFRNIHTIKGNARTYRFNDISELVHDIESNFSIVLENQTHLSKEQILPELELLDNLLNLYTQVLKEKLMIHNNDNLKANALIRDLEKILTITPNKINASQAIDQMKVRLLDYTTLSLDEIVTDLIQGLKDIAENVQKPVPMVKVDNCPGVRFRAEFGQTLKDCFTHFFRNAIDHGIEDSETRYQHNKPITGMISVSISKDNDGHHKLIIFDDGKGLNISQLRRLLSHDTASDTEVAMSIFNPGVSTLETITDISGRGVGMNAIKSFLKEYGADVSIHFRGERNSEGYQAFSTVINLPNEHIVMSK